MEKFLPIGIQNFENHLNIGKKIILVGINFSTRERRILDWKMEMV